MRPIKTLQKLYDEESQVVITEKGSPPRALFYGENFLLEDLPVGTRVIFPRPPLAGVPNVKAAIRWAINHPESMEPLHALMRPGMKLTCVIDDISVPLPPMAMPICAAFSAGASLTPSPVIATISPPALSASTNCSFCSGMIRAKTFTVFTHSESAAGVRLDNSFPVRQPPFVPMPACSAMASAVAG